METINLISLLVSHGNTQEAAVAQLNGMGIFDDYEALFIGTCWDGNNRAKVYGLEHGYYFVDGQAGYSISEEEPEDFRDLEESEI